jgi:hypothetical protein
VLKSEHGHVVRGDETLKGWKIMAQPVPTTIPDFVQACSSMDSDAIFELFEYEISESLRGEIFALSDPDSPEPLREALSLLGEKHNVQSLLDY